MAPIEPRRWALARLLQSAFVTPLARELGDASAHALSYLTRTACFDCGRDLDTIGEFAYCVTPAVWAAAVLAHEAAACVRCLERRLGRRLEPDDFSDAPINGWAWQQTSQLRQRIAWRAPRPHQRFVRGLLKTLHLG
jgi:hypothetical protein